MRIRDPETQAYRLTENNEVVPCESVEDFAAQLVDMGRRRIALTWFPGGTYVSTVFCAVPCCLMAMEGCRGLFETITTHMKDGEVEDRDTYRCFDWLRALRQHAEAVSEIQEQWDRGPC